MGENVNTAAASTEGTGHYRPDLQELPAQEKVTANMVGNGYVSATAIPVSVQPTQVRRPWRTVVRSAFQAAVALATLAPLVAAGVYDGADPDTYPAAVGQVLVVSSAVTRVMAMPQVEVFLRRFLPFLSAVPKEKTR